MLRSSPNRGVPGYGRSGLTRFAPRALRSWPEPVPAKAGSNSPSRKPKDLPNITAQDRAASLPNWLEVLQNDHTAIITAAAHAQRAAILPLNSACYRSQRDPAAFPHSICAPQQRIS